jgi:uncharacterized integral membrane protein (TIGR00698 family)
LARSIWILTVLTISLLSIFVDYALNARGLLSFGTGTMGFLFGLLISKKVNMDPLVNKVWVNTLLPLAIILLGFGLDIKVVFSDHIGFVGLVTIATSIFTAFTCTMLLSRALGIDRIEAFALGAGGAICGNSAVLAVAPSLRLSTKQTGSILAVVNILGLATFLSVPIMARVIGLHTDAAGIWAGATVHAVPQAIAAGEAMGGDALVLASGTKLTRVLALLLVVPLAATFSSRAGEIDGNTSKALSRIPMFLPGFIVASVASSFLLPESLSQPMEYSGSILMVPILVMIGMSIQFDDLLSASRPILTVGAISTICMMAATASALVILM